MHQLSQISMTVLGIMLAVECKSEICGKYVELVAIQDPAISKFSYIVSVLTLRVDYRSHGFS